MRPKIHERGNLLSYDKLRKGDVGKGFDQADVILERTYQVPFLEHAYMEPDLAMAVPQPDGTMLVEGPMQAPFTVRRNVAAVLGLPINKVRCRQIHMGGGFGARKTLQSIWAVGPQSWPNIPGGRCVWPLNGRRSLFRQPSAIP